MTHHHARHRSGPSAAFILAALLLLSTQAGCSSLHGWARGGSGRAATAGATVSLPLGK